MNFIPSFDFYSVFVEPWVVDTYATVVTVLMAFAVAAACGLVGNFFILRRMALLGDAISHSLLPGIVVAFLVTTSRNPTYLFLGALFSAIITTFLIEFIQKHSRLKADAAMGITFSSAFALGVILLSLLANFVDLDTECVLFGELALLPLESTILGIPSPLLYMLVLLIFLVLVSTLFHKQILASIFDPELAHILGISPKALHYALTITLAITITAAFRSVGAILVVGMLLFPASTARLMTSKLRLINFITLVLAALYAFIGIHLAYYLDCSIAGAITTCAFVIFITTWGCYYVKSSGLISLILQPNKL